MPKDVIRVLLVDDSKVALAILQRMLASAPDIEVVGTATNGRDALELIPRLQPALICTDFHMPQMDGLEFLRAMRATPAMANIAFILLTGRADRELVARAVQFGANNYLVKPFTAAILKQKIEQIVGPLS